MRKQYPAAFKAKLVLELLKETKTLSQLAAEHKVHPHQLRPGRDGALKELPTLFDKKDHTADVVAAHERQVEELYAEIGRLTTHVAWLKKNLVSTLPRASRLALVDREAGELPLVAPAELLGLSRASLYYQRVPPAAQEIAIKHRIDEVFTAHPFYGSRRLRVCLPREGVIINRKAVPWYRREMGIVAICPGPNLSKRELAHRVHPYLLRGVHAAQPDPIWGSDSTDVRLVAGWLYLVAVLNWFSRYVISWALRDSLEIEFVLAAVDSAGAALDTTNMARGSGQPFHQPAVYRAPASSPGADQHGWQGVRSGQHQDLLAVAQHQV